MKKNVLVFPAGSEIGLEVHRALSYSTHFNIIGGTSVPDHSQYVYADCITDIPFVDDPKFTEKIRAIVAERKIDFLFPVHDSVVLKLAQESAKGTLRCAVITSPLATCEIARSKAKTYKELASVMPVPNVFKSIDEVDDDNFPVFLKPDVGQGSKGTQIAKNRQDLAFYTQKDPSLLVLEYLPGKEYTIDCFTNKDGTLMLAEGRQRQRISNGTSVSSEGVEDERFGALAAAINGRLEFRGAWFFQVKERTSGELVLMEIAPRIAGTMGLVRCKGANLALLSLFDALSYDVEVFQNPNNLIIDRALQNCYKHDITYRHVYLDFDDLVIFEGKVNPAVMAFVYQCLNKDVAIHLITKHDDNLSTTLKKYRLTDVFDDLVWIAKDDDKYKYIQQKDAIFIDDSYAERKKVHDKLGIPVFDAHSIESLMEIF